MGNSETSIIHDLAGLRARGPARMSSSDEDTELDDAAQVTNAPAYDTKHLDVLKYRLNEIGEKCSRS